MISNNKGSKKLYLIEIKSLDSKEPLIRGILEIATYYKQLKHEKLLSDYGLDKKTKIAKGILVFGKNKKHEKELKGINEGESYLKQLIQALEIDIFTIDVNITNVNITNVNIG